MSKSLFKIALLAVLTAATMNSCSKNAASQADGAAAPAESAVAASDKTDISTGDNRIIADFITNMYNEGLYWEEDWLLAHCTPKMLQIMKDNYDYDGEGYAFWILRTSSNDSSGGSVLSVTTDDGQWFNYRFTDGDYEGENRLKCYIENGNVWIDDYESVYDGALESYRQSEE